MAVQTVRKPVALDRAGQRALRELRTLRAAKDEIDLKIKAKEKSIKDAMGAAESATVGGREVVIWKTSIRQGLSQTLLKKGWPDIVAECTVQTEVRTFKLIEDA
jgi:predicted phage-related endonuclease